MSGFCWQIAPLLNLLRADLFSALLPGDMMLREVLPLSVNLSKWLKHDKFLYKITSNVLWQYWSRKLSRKFWATLSFLYATWKQNIGKGIGGPMLFFTVGLTIGNVKLARLQGVNHSNPLLLWRTVIRAISLWSVARKKYKLGFKDISI
jgi:hypothetical protein